MSDLSDMLFSVARSSAKSLQSGYDMGLEQRAKELEAIKAQRDALFTALDKADRELSMECPLTALETIRSALAKVRS